MLPDLTLTSKDFSTLKVLASVENTLTLFGGSDTIWTNNKSQTIYYQTKLESMIPAGEHSFHDLRHFISFLGLFTDPVLEFSSGSVRITDGTGRTGTYNLSERQYSNTISKPIDLKTSDVTLPVPKDVFTDWRKAAKVIGSEFSVLSHTGLAQSRKGKADTYSIDMDLDTKHKFSLAILTENLDILENGEYRVDISFDHMIAKFTAQDGSYYILPANPKKSNVERA